jgi:hypothetical protein
MLPMQINKTRIFFMDIDELPNGAQRLRSWEGLHDSKISRRAARDGTESTPFS